MDLVGGIALTWVLGVPLLAVYRSGRPLPTLLLLGWLWSVYVSAFTAVLVTRGVSLLGAVWLAAGVGLALMPVVGLLLLWERSRPPGRR